MRDRTTRTYTDQAGQTTSKGKAVRRRKCTPLLVLLLALVAAACSTRVNHDDVVRANGAYVTGGAGAVGGSAGTSGGAAGTANVGSGALPSGGGSVSAGTAPAGTGGTAGGAPTTNQGTPGASNAAPTGNAATGAPIVIGNAGSYTGLGTAGLDLARTALQAWAADLNSRGGLKGHPIRVIVKDDGGDASKARAQVQELVEKDNVVALVGNLGYSSSADAWQGYIEQKKVPAVGGNCAAKGWFSSPVMFSQCPNPDVMFYGAVLLASRYGAGKKFGAMVCTEDSVCTTGQNDWFSKGYARKVGLDPVYQAQISLAQPDFTAQCVQAKSRGVQILALVVDPATAKRIMSSCSQQGFKPQYLTTYGEEASDTPKYAGDIISAQVQFPFLDLNTPAYQTFINVWRKYSDQDPTPFAATVWASAKIFEQAALQAKDLTRAGIIASLYRYQNQRFGGLTLPLSYGPKGTTNGSCIFYMRAGNGRWTTPLGDKPVCW